MTGELRSKIYDDIYFSTDDGLGESKAVFLDGIGAPQVWKNAKEFIICELGFGTGLNFLNTINEWITHSDNNQILHYIAIEKHPLDKSDIDEAIYWEELAEIKRVMLQKYPKGERFFDNRVKLTILVGDVGDQLIQLNEKIDAWYLDGFAPRKNPAMWTDEVFKLVAKCSKPSAKLATFTAAGFVRRGLEDAGFIMHKRPGFGKKREMLAGEFDIKKAVE
ncbi:MAG: tRNA (5-methylaminomethyl-2-thiouridine)(34)-methyltransferase MnmD [Emcibacteraceae bacterium]|nr:tRNA (5-methylaminomethyl-2-thiouridine)(34)-methyltransferase MnmD [Emcibacteraceae bacterium]